jgi:hypothetical protein
MLYAVLEEAEGAVVKVEQHAHTIALLVAASRIVVVLAVAEEGTVVSTVGATAATEDEPAVGAFTVVVFSCRVEVGLANANHDAAHYL